MARDWILDDMANENTVNEKSSLLDSTVDESLSTDSSPDNAEHEARRGRKTFIFGLFALIVLVLRISLAIEFLGLGQSDHSAHHHDIHLTHAHKILKETPLIGSHR